MTKFSEFYRLLEQNGFVLKKGKKHYKYYNPKTKRVVPVGRHPSHEIPTGTLESMMKQAGLK